MQHNHTPWPEYRKTLTTGGYNPQLVNDTMEGLTSTWDCPACRDNTESKEVRSNNGHAVQSTPYEERNK